MKPQDSWASAAPLRAWLDQLSDAVLLMDRHGAVRFANGVALRLLACEPGTPLAAMGAVIGMEATGWLKSAFEKHSRFGLIEHDCPIGVLPDGRLARLAWQPLDAVSYALTIAPEPAQRMQIAPVGNEPPAPPGRAPAGGEVSGEVANQLLQLIWASPYPSSLQDMNFRFVDVNDAYLKFTGYSREYIMGRDALDLHPPEDHARMLADRQRLNVDPRHPDVPALVERRLMAADGRERWYRLARRILQDASGRQFYLGVLQDSTAEHTARERAERSARELDDWFDLSPVGMVLYDESGLFVRTNPLFESLIGSAEVLLNDAPAPLQQLMAWEDGAPSTQLQPDGQPVVREGWATHPDGSSRRFRATVRCYRTPGGQRRFMAVLEDRSLEEERDLAQMQIGAMMDAAGVGLATFQESSGWVRPSWRPPTGMTRTDAAPPETPHSAALQNISRDIVLPESLPDYEKLQHALRQSQRAEVRYAIQHPTLGPRWLLTRVEPATLASGQRSTAVVTLDITDQHQSEARNQELLRELTTILDSTTAGIAYIRGDILVRCNRRFELMLRLPGSEESGSGRCAVAGQSIHSLFGHNEQAQRIAADTLQALTEGALYETEFQVPVHTRAGQGALWYALSVRRTGARGQVLEAIAMLSDITRLKNQQLELETVARDRELMFSVSEVGLAFVRGDRIQRANDALAKLLGYSSSELTQLPMARLFIDEIEFEHQAHLEAQALAELGYWMGELPLKRRDGRLLWVQVSKRLVIEGDTAGGIIASYVNVDDRHRAEQAVALQAERTRAILDSVLVGIVTVGPAGIEWMNRSARRMFGGDLADFINTPISTVATSEPDHPFMQTHYLNELIEGQAETFECRLKARDGRQFWVVGNVVATGRETVGRQLTYALLDIERRRQAEARIAQTQASLQRIIEAAPLAITLRDAKSLRVLQLNETAARTVGRSVSAAVGLSLQEMYEPEAAEMMRLDMQEALRSSEVTKREYTLQTDGQLRVWDARFMPLSTQSPSTTSPDAQHPEPDQLLLVATDVTEQRAAQQAKFDAAIAQREMLVKEVHHRIKNNLQGVAGLLQQIAQRKPEVAPAMSEVVTQVQAIAHVYGLQVGTDGPLQLASVLQAITGSVQRTFGHPIDLHMAAEATAPTPECWVLPEAESIPVALSLNEMLTNAIKHNRSDLAVQCDLLSLPTGITVTVSNVGALREDFDLAKVPGGVSGLGLIRALLPRRSATFKLVQDVDRVRAEVSLVSPGVRLKEPSGDKKPS